MTTEHPLQMEAVVENIFKYFRLKDIKNSRMVCKLWDVIGTKRLVKRIDEVRIKFDANSVTELYFSSKSIKHFLQMADTFRFKFNNFDTFHFETGLSETVPKAAETVLLMNRYGQHIKEIRFRMLGENCWKFLSDILTTRAPNLEVLYLHCYPDQRVVGKKLFHLTKPQLQLKTIMFRSSDKYDEPIFSRELLSDLFQCSPHLERIAVTTQSNKLDTDKASAQENLVLETLASTGNISQLKHLGLECTEETLAVLVSSYKQAPLKTFHVRLNIVASIKTLQYFSTFLMDHKDTWTTLKLRFPCVDNSMGLMVGITFPVISQLTFLDIDAYCIIEEELDTGHAPLATIKFKEQFPKLETLILRECHKTRPSTYFNPVTLFSKQPPLLSLRNLTLPPQFHVNVLSRIGRIFPNVTQLEVVIQTGAALKQLWITWPQLKKLTVTIIPAVSIAFGSASLDSIFTGIPETSLTATENNSMIPAAVGSFPYIGALKKLTHLTIKGLGLYGSSKAQETISSTLKISDHTARLALFSLKELVFLGITRDRHTISPSCTQYLSKALDLHQVKGESALRLVKYPWQKTIYIDW